MPRPGAGADGVDDRRRRRPPPYHRIALDGPAIAARPRRSVTVVGNICETGDVLAADRSLPEPVPGDVVMVGDAGAYGYSMSSSYNARPRPAEVLIRTDGSAELVRRRETLDELLALFPGGRRLRESEPRTSEAHAASNGSGPRSRSTRGQRA